MHESDLISQEPHSCRFLTGPLPPSQRAECNLGLVLTSEEPESVSARDERPAAPADNTNLITAGIRYDTGCN